MIVLVAEDDLDLLETVREVLMTEGYCVYTATNGAEAVAVARREHGKIALFLTDLLMPELDGYQAAEEMKKVHPETQVLYMTGHAGEVLTKSADSIKNFPLLKKPFMLDDLLERIRKMTA